MEFIKGFFDIQSAASFLLGLIPGGFFVYKLVSFLIRKEIRLFKNLKRKIYLMNTDSTNILQREKTLLIQNGLYQINNDVLSLSDLGILETTEKFSVFVIAYSKTFSHYQKVIDRAKRDSIPVIFLAAGPRDITDEHLALFKDYPYFEMCNTSARMLTTIFNLSAVTPNEKK